MPPKKRACESDDAPPAKVADLSNLFEGVPPPRHAREVARELHENEVAARRAREAKEKEKLQHKSQETLRIIASTAHELQKLIDAELKRPTATHNSMEISSPFPYYNVDENLVCARLHERFNCFYAPFGYDINIFLRIAGKSPHRLVVVTININPEFAHVDP